MLNNSSTMRQLSADELDQVGGGLSIAAGLGIDASAEVAAVSGLVGQVGGLVGGLANGALGAAGGLVGGVLGKV